MGKIGGSGSTARRTIAERFRSFLSIHAHGHRDERLDLITDERVIDDVGVSRERLRTPVYEAHWFYDKQR